MKRTMLVTTVLILASCFLVGNGSAAAKETILKAASPWPKTHDNNVLLFEFFDLVEKKSGGTLKIEWAGGPELFKARDLPRAAAAGSIDVFHYALGYLGRKVPEAGIYDAYPGGQNFENNAKVLKEGLKFLSPILEKKVKIKPFGSTVFYPFYLWTKKPVRTFEDLKGLKVRVHGGLAPHLIRALGASVVTMPSTDVYMALERGVIEGALRNLASFNAFREYEFCKFGIDIPMHIGGLPIFVSVRRWEKLDETQKKAIAEAGDQIAERAGEFWKAKNDEFLGQLKSQGVTFFDPPPGFKAKWRKLTVEGGKKAAKKMSPANAEKVIAIIEKYAK